MLKEGQGGRSGEMRDFFPQSQRSTIDRGIVRAKYNSDLEITQKNGPEIYAGWIKRFASNLLLLCALSRELPGARQTLGTV